MKDPRLIFTAMRAIEELQLYSEIQSGKHFCQIAEWKSFLEKTLKLTLIEIINEGTLTTMPSIIEDIITTRTLASEERSRLNGLLKQVQAAEKALADTREALKVSVIQLNQEICALKDHLDDEAERASRKLGVCRDYEQRLVQEMHEHNRQQLKIWDDKIQALESEIDQECQRSSCVESDLCAAIEELQQHLAYLRKTWKETIERQEAETQSLNEKQAYVRPRIESVTKTLKERQLVVDEEVQAERAREEEMMRAMKYLRAIIKIQAWWRGVMARKSYARQKMMRKGKGKRKKQAVIDKNALNNEK